MPIKRHLRPNSTLAFTLMELLVVIGIIVVLAALVILAVGRGKQKSHRLQCISNLRQQGVALQGFVTDFHAYPLYRNVDYSGGAYPGGVHSWLSVIEEYQLSGQGRKALRVAFSNSTTHTIWRCPSKPASELASRTDATHVTATSSISYGYNAFGLRRDQGSESLGLGGNVETSAGYRVSRPITETDVLAPSRMIAIGDAFMGGNGAIVDNRDRIERMSDFHDDFGSMQRVYSRHQGRANVVFADGHVEELTLKSLFEGVTDESLSRWNRDGKPHRERIGP